MKSPIIKILVYMCLLALPLAEASAQFQVDATLNANVLLNTSSGGKKLDQTNDELKKISATNALMTVTLDSIRSYQQIMLTGLKTVHRAFNDMFTVVDCIDKSKAIIDELNKCSVSAENNPEGALVSLILSKNYSRILQESSGLVSNITNLVKGGGDKNLLNSAERLQILNSTHSSICAIYRRVRSLRAQIEWYRLADIPATLVPEIYYNHNATERAYKRCVDDIQRLKKAW